MNRVRVLGSGPHTPTQFFWEYPPPPGVSTIFQNKFWCKTLQNEFNLCENEPVVGTHFHMNSFAPRLVLTQMQKETWKWPIVKIRKTFLNSNARIK